MKKIFIVILLLLNFSSTILALEMIDDCTCSGHYEIRGGIYTYDWRMNNAHNYQQYSPELVPRQLKVYHGCAFDGDYVISYTEDRNFKHLYSVPLYPHLADGGGVLLYYGYWENWSKYTYHKCYPCAQPSEPTPPPPEDTNTTHWELVSEVSCKDENATLPAVCTDANETNILIQSWKTGCCGENKRCYVGVPVCDQNDTDYPPLASNEHTLFEWTKNDTDRSAECERVHGKIQDRRIKCKTEYRCIINTDELPKECDEPISSYVSPRNESFHEDITLPGVDFALHYTSYERNNTIAQGWMPSSYAYVKNDTLHLGSGRLYAVTQSSTEGSLTVTPYGSNEYLFDTDGKLQSIRDLYTKETKSTFGYDNMGRLVTITDIYGEISTIERDSNGRATSIVAPTGQRTLLSIDNDGDLIEIQYEDTSSYVFEYERHLMTKETEPNGNAFLHFFDDAGNVVKVIDAEQGEWSFGSIFSDAFNTHTVTRPSGDIVTYRNYFIQNGILKSEKTLPTGDVVLYENAIDDSNSSITSCGMKTVNIYKKNTDGTLYRDPYTHRRMLETRIMTTPSGLRKITHYRKTYTSNNGRVTTVSSTTETNNKLFSNLRDYAAFKASSTTAENKTSQMDYDSHNQNITSMKPYGLLETTYSYDAQGRVTAKHTGERTTTYSYDAQGNLESVTDPLGQSMHYTYDDRGRMLSATYADGSTEHFAYDSNGNLVTRTVPTPADHHFGYNGVNKRTSHDSPLGKNTTYSYDKQRRLINITKPSGASIDYTYTNGRLTSAVTPDGTTEYSYGCQSNIRSITTSSGSADDERMDFTYDGTLLTSIIQSGILDQTITYTYNNDFLPTTMTYAGATTVYRYNKDGELIHSGTFDITRSLEGTLKQTITDGTYTQATRYNGYAELSAQEDTTLPVKLSRNTNGQIVQKEETLSGKKTTYTYSYDSRGRLVEVNATGAAASTQINLVSNPGIESLSGDVPEEWHPYGDNDTPVADTQSHSGEYALKINNPDSGRSGWRGKEITIHHERTLTFSGWSKAEDVSSGALYALDFKVTFDDGSYLWYYHDAKFATGTHDWQHIEVTKTFGKPVVRVRPYVLLYRGSGTVWFDDISVQEGTVPQHGLYNGDFESISGETPTGWRSYRNDTPVAVSDEKHSGEHAIKITNTTATNAGWYSREFDVNGSHDLTFSGWSKSEDVSDDALYALDFKVTFDDGSYLWYYHDTKFATGTHDWQHIEVNRTFDKPVVRIRAYALLYRGTGTAWFDDIAVTDNEAAEQPESSSVVERYAYDANGNRASATVYGKTYVGRYTLDDNVIVYGDNTYRYDDDGYLIEKTEPQGSTQYAYNTLGALTDVTLPGGTQIRYPQDALNRRVAKEVNGTVVEKYLWEDLTALLAVYDGNDRLVWRFEYADGRMPVAMSDDSGAKYYLHYDQVGSLRAVSDTNGNVVKEITYDTFGNILSDSNPNFKVPFGFAGGLYDPDTKLTHFGYREYDAFTGKWTAKDPIGFAGGDSNLYGYVLNDPVNLVDPDGLKSFKKWLQEKLGGEAKARARKKRFCQECQWGFEHNLSDEEICQAYIPQVIKWCGEDGSCRQDYSTWAVNGCKKTCQ